MISVKSVLNLAPHWLSYYLLQEIEFWRTLSSPISTVCCPCSWHPSACPRTTRSQLLSGKRYYRLCLPQYWSCFICFHRSINGWWELAWIMKPWPLICYPVDCPVNASWTTLNADPQIAGDKGATTAAAGLRDQGPDDHAEHQTQTCSDHWC